MTGYTVHTGSSRKFAQGWDQVFQGKAATKQAATTSRQKSAPAKADAPAVKPAKKVRKTK